jgi:CRP/FNR family cyclic AMP-dependent transcriptional regulator
LVVRRIEQWRSKLLSVLGDQFVAEDVDRLLAGAVVEPFPRRAILYSPGDVSEQIYVLLAGVVTLSVLAPDGAPVVIQLLRPGAIFGYSAFLPGRERQLRAEALTDVEVAAVSRDHFASVMASVGPDGQAALLARFAHMIGRLAHRQMALAALPAEDRLLSVLEELGADFGIRDSRGIVIDLRLTQETLAAIAGASRQRINVALSELVRQGRISKDGPRIVLRASRDGEETHASRTTKPAPMRA